MAECVIAIARVDRGAARLTAHLRKCLTKLVMEPLPLDAAQLSGWLYKYGNVTLNSLDR